MGKFSDRMSSPRETKYRECMHEIMGVLKKYDMAGAVTVVDKERCMFKYFFPKWTCIELGENYLRLRSKAEDFPSKEAQHENARWTAHVIMQMGDTANNTLNMVNHLAAAMSKAWGMKHTPGADFDPERSH